MSRKWKFTKQSSSNGIYQIVMSRPDQLNALSGDMYGEIKAGIFIAGGDPLVDVIVLRGNERSFATGGDIKDALSMLERDDFYSKFMEEYLEQIPMRAMLTVPKVIVSVVEGLCLAAGIIFAAISDVVIATENATFGVPEGRIGLADPFTSMYLSTHIGLMRSKFLVMTGQTIDARQAERWGLVTVVCAPEDLEEETDRIVRLLRSTSPEARATYKESMNRLYPPADTSGLVRHLMSANGLEGMSAFAERRLPNWVNGPDATTQ